MDNDNFILFFWESNNVNKTSFLLVVKCSGVCVCFFFNINVLEIFFEFVFGDRNVLFLFSIRILYGIINYFLVRFF